jgi:hypothetical protein
MLTPMLAVAMINSAVDRTGAKIECVEVLIKKMLYQVVAAVSTTYYIALDCEKTISRNVGMGSAVIPVMQLPFAEISRHLVVCCRARELKNADVVGSNLPRAAWKGTYLVTKP